MENNEVVKQESGISIIKHANNTYSSFKPKTTEERKKLFNALEKCDVLLNDCVGQEIEIEDIYVEETQSQDEETGEIKPKFRTIIFDKSGQTYATGSYGIYNVMKKIVGIYGLPDSWEKPLKVKVAKRTTKDNKQTLTLVLL